jgi:hypothetical protein
MSVDVRSARPASTCRSACGSSSSSAGRHGRCVATAYGIVTIEPDTATLQAMGLNMMSARRIDEIEDHTYQHACRRRQAAVSTTRDWPTEPTA